MDFLKAIIHPTYWLTHQHPVPERWAYALIILFGLLCLAGLTAILLSFRGNLATPMRTLLKKIAAYGWTMGLLGYLFLFFSLQQIAFLSVRMIYLVWAVIAIWWLYHVLHYAFKVLPKRIAEIQAREQREKYLPHASR